MQFDSLSNSQLQQLMQEAPDLQLIDVRTVEEYHFLGHIPSARLLPLHELPERLNHLNPQQPVAVVCQHGVRSVRACEYLHQNGFQHIYNLTDGMAEWDGECQTSKAMTPAMA